MESFPVRIGYDDACRLIDDAAARHRLPVERLPLARAHGHVLAEDVRAVLPQPPFDNAAMDGFACRHADLAHAGRDGLLLAGEQFAGPTAVARVDAGHCVRITTGAPLPDGADTVVMKEAATVEGDRVRFPGNALAGQFVRRAGEDCRQGDLLAVAGQALASGQLALFAAQGMTDVAVYRRPTVAVFTTGDELVEPGMPLAPGMIYNANRVQLMALLREAGLEPTAWPTLPDDPGQIYSALLHAGHAFDVVLTCGGVSAGEKDHLPQLLRERARILFWKARLKPGMPVLLAEGGSLGNALFLCLPGNPVSVLATWLALGRRLTDGLQGRAPRSLRSAKLTQDWDKRHERLEFLRGRLLDDGDGVLHVEPNAADGSHRMRAAADSDALIVLDEGARHYRAGTPVGIIAY
ncbi:molybdopterin molybdotransferase MoeA [Luteimonas yindakuii]|uniref:Molybdopterin molybdenumtransferase n=1 Tax=Luteimonas yindakuii TaxID=2565782 RepID=A0A4Z1R367_9GAMM|nr:gephyrin-like molybdotransferase Glp [Luteimonas yindakuii]TKS53930.1 molybdopterin molybdotransferase MoeA [Luteimonas yindakuii]